MNSAQKFMVFLVFFALAWGVAASELEVGQHFRDCPDCSLMVIVLSGSFLMGDTSVGEVFGRRQVSDIYGDSSVACSGCFRDDVYGVGRLCCGRQLRFNSEPLGSLITPEP